jgi:pimeloyl-ACP methyl ester carboxylesterase
VLISMPSGAPFLIDRYREMFGIGAATTEKFLQRFSRRFGHAPAWFEVTRVIDSLSLPLLFVHDEADDVVPADQATHLAAAAPQARVHLSRGLGHSTLLRDPGTIRVITDFAKEIENV